MPECNSGDNYVGEHSVTRNMCLLLVTTRDICNISPGRLNRVKAGLVIGGCICADDCFFDGLMDSVSD